MLPTVSLNRDLPCSRGAEPQVVNRLFKHLTVRSMVCRLSRLSMGSCYCDSCKLHSSHPTSLVEGGCAAFACCKPTPITTLTLLISDDSEPITTLMLQVA